MTLTFEHYLDRLKMNRLAKYLGQMSFSSKVLVLTQTDTHIGPIALLGPIKWLVRSLKMFCDNCLVAMSKTS